MRSFLLAAAIVTTASMLLPSQTDAATRGIFRDPAGCGKGVARGGACGLRAPPRLRSAWLRLAHGLWTPLVKPGQTPRV